ncbi:hypothetical protein ABZS66_45620 [Dactylosporangium sp. NPDC005572]|uniref:hypothetical protein n=1 Tax=Dactylosporangium sp. NPDC005572 TaxID=3156889 RepID=UPI0033A89790
MADEVRADPVALTRLAYNMLLVSRSVNGAWTDAQSGLALPVEAFGDTLSAPQVGKLHGQVVDSVSITTGRFVGVLENMMDALYGVAFTYKAVDQGSADHIGEAAPAPAS